MALQAYWADLTAAAFAELPRDLVVVLPIGAIEQHGPHLPVSVDRDLVDAVIGRTWAQLSDAQNVLVLPTLAVTKSGEHGRHPGTLALSAETLLATLRETGASIAKAGISRLVFLNGHGGNNAVLEIAARDLRIEHEMTVVNCSWFGFADYADLFDIEELPHDIHGGDVETSAMLAARPDLVNMDLARNFISASATWEKSYKFIGLTGQPARPGWIADDLNLDGACGNAAAATPEKGEHLLQSAATNFALFLAEFAEFDVRSST